MPHGCQARGTTIAGLALPVWAFAAVTVPLVLSPGATTAVVLRNSIAGGSRTGVFTALGANAASCCYGLLTAFGFAATLQRWPSVWLALRWAGVAYLSWLGIRSLVAALRTGRNVGPDQRERPRATPASGWTSGFLTNAFNPSLTAFYLIVVPQFIPRGEPFIQSALTLTAIHVSLAFTWHVCWAVAGATLARLLSRTRARQVLEIITGAALLVLAANLLAP